MAVTAPQRQQKVIELLSGHGVIATFEHYEQCNTQHAQSRRTPSTPGTTCTRRRASRLETWPGMLHSALRTASASSGLTIQGRTSLSFFFNIFCRVSKCWMKTSDQGRGPSTKGSVSGQKACGAPGDLKSSSEHLSVVGALSEEPEQPEQTSGHLTSPNFPANYPNGLHERKTIEVAKGNVIKIHFTDFDLERPDEVDYVDLTDGDGSFLGRFGARHYVDEEGSGEGSGDEGPGR